LFKFLVDVADFPLSMAFSETRNLPPKQSWLGLFEQFFRFDKWNACRVQAAAICDSRLK
jgi:hypothetical protein